MPEPGEMTGLAKRYGSPICAAVAAAIAWLPISSHAGAETDVLEQAINYVFTGEIAPQKDLEIVDRNACIVQLTDPDSKRATRYYLSRFKMDTARYEKIYSGRLPSYRLYVEGDDDVVEFLNPDMTVSHAHRSARFPLPGNIDRSQRALRLIAEKCKHEATKELPF